MGRIYTAGFENVAVTVAQDFFEIAPAANKPVRLKALIIGQHSDMGDAAEEGLRAAIIRVPATVTGGSGGSTPALRKVRPTDQDAGVVVEANNTSQATTSGTLEYLALLSVNNRIGLELWFPPELQFEVINGTVLVVRLMAAPADSLSMSGTCWLEEEG